MAMTVRGCPKLDHNLNVPQQEEQSDAIDGKVLADCKPDIDNEPEGSDPLIELVDYIEEDPYTEYLKMEIPCQGTVHQRSMS